MGFPQTFINDIDKKSYLLNLLSLAVFSGVHLGVDTACGSLRMRIWPGELSFSAQQALWASATQCSRHYMHLYTGVVWQHSPWGDPSPRSSGSSCSQTPRYPQFPSYPGLEQCSGYCRALATQCLAYPCDFKV